ncbi:MAG: hypothetical protein ABI386_06595 [Rhodanobacter sp.]
MRRVVRNLLVTALLLGATAALAGCVVVSPRGRLWVPGYWGPPHVWVGAHWRRR